MGRKPKFTVAQIAAMQRSRDSGMTLQQVADEHGCSVSYVHTHTINHRKQDQTERQKKHHRLTGLDKERIREGWRERMTVEDIADMMLVSKSVISKYIQDVADSERVPAPPKPPKSLAEAERRFRALEQETVKEDERRNNAPRRAGIVTTAPKEKVLDWTIVHEPIPDRGWDVTGPHPDIELSMYCQDVIDQWVKAVGRGRIFDPTPIAVIQAIYVYASSMPVWDYDTFLEQRGLWAAVRALSGVNSTDLAARLGISPASISRYESGDRSPDRQMLHRIHDAYTQLLEDTLTNSELGLTLRSWGDTEGELIATQEGYAAFVAQEMDLEEFTIDHIEHLATVRAMLPNPTWREPTAKNLLLVGYPNQPALTPV